MRKIALSLAVLGASLLAVLYTAPAHAVGTQSRVYVAFNGNDSNAPCNVPTSACKTFQTAVNNTVSGGEVTCLTSGEFGPATITWPVTIDCTGVYAGIEPGSGVSGITINITGFLGAGVVTIRGVNIDGINAGTSGTSGITIFAIATTVNIEDVTIKNFAGSNSGIYDGRSAGGTQLVVKHTAVQDNNFGGTGAGIWSNASGGGGTPSTPANNVTLEDVLVTGNFNGIVADSQNNITVSRSVVSGNTTGINGNNGTVLLESTKVGANGTGIIANGGIIGIANSDISFNTTAFTGTTYSYANNRVFGNGSIGTPLGYGPQYNYACGGCNNSGQPILPNSQE